jgi:galactoside O-acetyltransferase
MKTYGGHYLGSSELRELGCRAVGEDVRVHSTCVMVGLENISFGRHVRVDGFCSLIAADGHIALGDHVHVASYALLSGGAGIDLADFSGLSNGVKLFSRSDDYSGATLTNPTVPAEYLGVNQGPIRLGRHVIVGAGTVVLPGCEIGDGCAVGALSLVRSSLPDWGVYFGNPVRRLEDRGRDLLELERRLLAAERGDEG